MNLQEQLSCSVQKTAGKNSQYSRNETILKIGHFGKSIAHAKCAVWVKSFFSKNMSKMNLQEQLSCSVQKTAGKNSQYSRNRNILKIDHFDKSIAHAKCAVWVKTFFSKNMPKMNLQEQIICSVQKTAGKNSQYSRNETILKIDHFSKSIAYAKWAVWIKIFFLQKYAENESTRTIKLFFARNR